jgi:CheY-like chemotaxis protein
VIITLDVMMPEMDGWSVLAQLKADPELARIPVIMQTIVDEPQKAYTLGAADHLTKPIDRAQMVEAVRRLRRTGNQTALLLSEDASVLEQVSHFLSAEGWGVASVTESARGCELLKERKPTLVVVDLGMSRSDGVAFVDAVRGCPEGEDVQIIVVMPEGLDEAGARRLNGSVQRVVHSSAKGIDAVVSEIRRILHSPSREAASAG